MFFVSMRKSLSVLILTLAVFLFSFSPAFAKTPVPSPTPVPNSYELFWPLSAGLTLDSPLFFLKELKEKFSGMLLVGEAKKAEYDLTLATKRILESEKLARGGKLELSDKSLSKSLGLAESSQKLFEKARNSGDTPQVRDEVIKKIENIDAFSPTLKDLTDDNGDRIIGQIHDVLAKVLNLVK